MPNFPFLKIPVAIGGAGLGTIASADQRPMFPPSPETDTVGHWDLGGNSLSLIDMVNGRILTPNATAPAYDATGITIASGGMNGLISDIADKANAFTVAFAVQLQPNMGVGGQSAMHFGTMTPSNGDGLGGCVFTDGGTGTLSITSNDRNAGASQTLARTTASLATLNNAWLFVLKSVDAAGNRFLYVPGFPVVSDGPITKTPSPARKLALGNAYYPLAAWYYGQRYSELMVWDRGLTQAEAVAVFQRSVQRLKYKKGITLYGA